VTLSAPGPWTSVTWTSDPPGQPGDGARTPDVTVAPPFDTTYTATVTGTDGCTGSAVAAVTIVPDTVPGPLGSSLRLRREAAAGILFSWRDLPGTWGDSEVVALPEDLGPPTPAAMDGPLASLVASAPHGTGSGVDDDGLALRRGAP
jgi:hypothetical protein